MSSRSVSGRDGYIVKNEMVKRSEILEMLGKLPKRVAPEFKVEREEKEDGYIRQTVSYNVEDGERITAYLLVPSKGKRPYPAVIAVHQHNDTFNVGKCEPCGLAGDPNMFYGLELVRRGYIVLAPDLLCFEDRRSEKYKQSEYDRKCIFETLTANYLLAEGKTLCGKYVHDLSIAVDVLSVHPLADKEKIGVIGHSTGGQSALWLTWYDERVKAGVSSCGFARAEDLMKEMKGHNLAMVVPGMIGKFDYEDILGQIAPRPFFYSYGTYDPTFLYESCKTLTERVTETYIDAGCGQNLEPVCFEGWHWFLPQIRERAYKWLDTRLTGGVV